MHTSSSPLQWRRQSGFVTFTDRVNFLLSHYYVWGPLKCFVEVDGLLSAVQFCTYGTSYLMLCYCISGSLHTVCTPLFLRNLWWGCNPHILTPRESRGEFPILLLHTPCCSNAPCLLILVSFVRIRYQHRTFWFNWEKKYPRLSCIHTRIVCVRLALDQLH